MPSTFNGNNTYTAQWSIIKYTFTFNLNGGSIGGSTANRTTNGNSGSSSSTPGTPTRTGYTFGGWNPAVPSTFNGNNTYTAKWTVITYTISYDRNGGSGTLLHKLELMVEHMFIHILIHQQEVVIHLMGGCHI